jgi:hypothetical protein
MIPKIAQLDEVVLLPLLVPLELELELELVSEQAQEISR